MVATLREYGAEDDFGTAVFSRDVSKTRRFLKGDAEFLASAFIRPTFTLLHVSAELGHLGLTRLFLEAGLDPCQADADGHCPLRFAARNSPAVGVMATLVDAGADVNAASKTGITALSAACRSNESLKSVIWLLENGAAPNQVPKDGNSALLRAVRLKNTRMVRALLEHGANPNHTDKKGDSALSIATKKKATAIAALLKKGG
jgi:ankyrin repeat protein